MRNLSFIPSALAVCLANSALAQDGDQDWSGYYFGGQIGIHELDFPSSLVPGGQLFEGDGNTYGVHAGYQRDLGTYVVGAEVSVDFSSTDLTNSVTGNPAPREVKQLAVVKAIAGYDGGQWMPYAHLGYGWQEFNDTTGSPGDQTFKGAIYGVGIKYLLTPDFMLGGEVSWYDFDGESNSSITSEGTTFSLRLSYKR